MRFNQRLPANREQIQNGLTKIKDENIISRIWKRDHTVWQPDPTEITNRLGWLDIAKRIEGDIPRIHLFVKDLVGDGFTQALLMGMGGSSLAPEVFSLTFGENQPPLVLEVLDSTDPAAIREQKARLDPERTLFIVATKSGTTVETLSFFKYFYNWTVDLLGSSRAGDHFLGITDPGSKLVQLGERHGFRELFLNDPEIGGRYSALSFFGLVPATLCGVKIDRLLTQAQAMMARCKPGAHVEENPGAQLGNILGILAQEGRDKVTFTTSPKLASFPQWIEQLLAESTGKSGKGILPVVGEPLLSADVYGKDRLFVDLSINHQHENSTILTNLNQAGHPVINVELSDIYELGGQFFLWEFATALAGYHLDIHPFNQPNVESAKVRARERVQAYEKEGVLPEGQTSPLTREELSTFISSRRERARYLAIQAFIPPTPQNEKALTDLRVKLRDEYKLPTTLGFGPRFLHSTGQLHKGDAGRGLFIQFTSRPEEDIPIPQEAGRKSSQIDFGTLKMAQALGDAQALRDAGREMIRFSLGTNPAQTLADFVSSY